MNYILPVLIFLSQVMIFPDLSFRWAKEVSMQILILFYLCYLVWKKNKWISLFLIWSSILFFWGKAFIVNDIGATITYSMNPIMFLNIINIVLLVLFYYILHNIKLDDKIYRVMCAIGIFEACYVILQFFQIDQFFYNFSMASGGMVKHFAWPVGTMGNEALVSWLITFCSPFFLKFKEPKYKIWYVLCFLAVLATKVTTSLLAFVVGFLFWLWHKNKKITIYIVLALVICGAVLIHSGKAEYYLRDTHRFAIWKKAINLCMEKPNGRAITGFGLGSFRETFYIKAPEFSRDGHWAQAHNEFIQIFYEQGIVGVIIALGLIFNIFLGFIRSKRGLIPLTSLVVFLVIMITGFPLRTAMGGLAVISLVLFEKEMEWEEEAT